MDSHRRRRCTYIALLLMPYAYVLYSFRLNPSSSIDHSIHNKSFSNVNKAARTLLIYVWANTDIQSLGNLEFFIRYGVDASQPVDYYFILQKVNNRPVNESSLPTLPPNAHYVQHDNQCYDLGTFGWFLSSQIVDARIYKYFIFMNASVRGPYFTAYFRAHAAHWYTVFTELLSNEVKLAGSTINCQEKPHVQSYLLVTDQVGFTILTNNITGVFSCKKDYMDAVVNGEIEASQLILRANYQIASLQIKYQGVDFRLKSNWNCNNRVSPIFIDRSVDGITHDPYELVFVKYKGTPPFDTDLERRAMIYQKWLEEQPIVNRTHRFKNVNMND
jgi:hypothetical protein